MPVRRRQDREGWMVAISYKGRVHRRSSRRWSRQQALEIERKLLADVHALEAGKNPERGFHEAVTRWKAEELPKHRDPPRENSHMLALAPFLEERRLIDAPDIAGEIKQQWSDLSPATINRRLALLRRLVNLAWKQWGWLDQPIGQRITLLPDRGERHSYLTEKEVRKLAAEMPRSGGYALLAAYTGIRRGQLLKLTAADVIGDCLNLGTDGKTGQPQLIPLHPKIKALAKRLPLCTEHILRDEWRAARKKLGLYHYHFHDLRHTAASWMLHAGGDLMHVRDLLGHSSVSVTQRYAHLKVKHLRKFVKKMGKT